MALRMRTVCLCLAICFLLGSLASSPSFAAAKDTQNKSGTAASGAGAAAGKPAVTTPSAVTLTTSGSALDWYTKKIPMKKEHQLLLWEYCKKRGLDYIDMLTLIAVESNFSEKCSHKSYRGYFQISKAHGPNLSKTLKTQNKPLDGAININWGTAMYYWILADKRVKGLEGKARRDAALSIFQRGTLGYDKYGINKSYLKVYYKKREIIASYFGTDGAL